MQLPSGFHFLNYSHENVKKFAMQLQQWSFSWNNCVF